jgi:hypothetical protein
MHPTIHNDIWVVSLVNVLCTYLVDTLLVYITSTVEGLFVSFQQLSLCTGILEIKAPPVMWRFSDLGALELYVL